MYKREQNVYRRPWPGRSLHFGRTLFAGEIFYFVQSCTKLYRTRGGEFWTWIGRPDRVVRIERIGVVGLDVGHLDPFFFWTRAPEGGFAEGSGFGVNRKATFQQVLTSARVL